MYLFANVALLVFPFFVLTLFLSLKPSKAIFASYILGWLYLPLSSINIPGLPDYGKFSATNIAMLPCLMFFAFLRISRFRVHASDLAMAIWILTPFVSSVTNGLGPYDGMSVVVNHSLLYGVPYFAGKIALQSLDDWCILARYLTIGAASYIPLCLIEMRMSPQLHGWCYGFGGRTNFEYSGIFGPFGWQPTVFMNSAFEVSMMFVVSYFLFIAVSSEMPSRMFGVSRFRIPWILGLMVLLCKKWSGFGLLILGHIAVRFKSKWLVSSLFAFSIIYMGFFTSGLYRGEGLSGQVNLLSERRAESLQSRLDNDVRLVEKAMQQPIFGWGGWGRNRVYDENGKDVAVTDSLWMIILGTSGTVGLIAMCSIYILPSFSFLARKEVSRKDEPSTSNLTVINSIGINCVIILALHLIDNLFNAFPSSIYPMLAGGMSVFKLLETGATGSACERGCFAIAKGCSSISMKYKT